MATVSFTRDVKITGKDANKIISMLDKSEDIKNAKKIYINQNNKTLIEINDVLKNIIGDIYGKECF